MEAQRVVGWNIRRFRVGLRLTIEDLAERAGIDSSYVARIERGAVNASIGKIAALAKALNVKMVDLVVEPPAGAQPPQPLPAGRRPAKRRGRL